MNERKFYDKALEQAGVPYGWNANGYGMQLNQQNHFRMFKERCLQVSDGPSTPFRSIVDVGCGTGDLLRYLVGEGIQPDRYLGIDRHPGMVKHTEQTIAELMPERLLLKWDAVQGKEGTLYRWGPADFVVSFGLLGFKPEQESPRWTFEQFEHLMAEMVMYANKAAVISLFSAWKTNVLPEEAVLDPAMVLSWALAEYERVELIHSYAPHDFMLIVWTEESEWRKEWKSQQESAS